MECLFLNRTYILDTETTGLEDNDEILQLSIINGLGDICYNSYYKPIYKKEWPEAEKVNHITPEKVKDCNLFIEACIPAFEIIEQGQAIVGYNLPFDLRMIKNNRASALLPAGIKYIDCMPAMKKLITAPWVSLVTASKHFNYQPTGDFHDSIEDCRATLHVFKSLCEAEALPYRLI